MRRVVSVWFPLQPPGQPWQPEEGRGSAPNPAKGRRPLEPRDWVGGQQGATRRLTGHSSPLLTTHPISGIKGGVAPFAGPGQSLGLPLTALAEWAMRYAPLAGIDPPDGLWIDVTGGVHLHGGETRLLRDLVSRLADRGLVARAAVADTPAVAHAAARFGAGGVVLPGADVMAGFPVEALRLPPDIVAALRLMGFERVGPLAAAARAPLVRRFGTELARRLDQAAGVVFEPIVPVAPAASIQARLGFVEPLLTAEAFSTVITALVAQVCGGLERAGQGARRLDLRFERVDGSVQAIRIGTARPVRKARHLGRMLDERLERIDPGLGVEAMHLIVAIADPLGFVQTASSVVAEPSPDLAPLIDRLTNRLGETGVYRVAPVESDVPERSVRLVPALTRVAGGWPADLPRPVRLLDPPQPIETMALLPDHPPVAFTWRRVRHLVRHADGPERIAGEWWKRDREWSSVRDYFRVEDEDGRRFWLFRRGNGSDIETGDMRWFLHGFF
jgi:protein ImuB